MKMVDYEQYLFRDEKAEASNKKEYDNMTGFKKPSKPVWFMYILQYSIEFA